MKKIKIAILFALFIIMLLLCNKVNAASITLSPNKSNITEGDEFTISMNLSGASLASLNVKITVDTSKVEYISSSSPDYTNFNNGKILYTWTDPKGGSNPKTDGTIVTFRLKAKSAGTASFDVSGKFYDSNENSINMSLNGTNVKITEKETEIIPPTNNTEETPNPPEINTEPPEVPNVPSNEEITPQPPEENNNREPEINNNDNNSNNNSQLSSNAFLSSLQIDVEGISPRFNKNTTNYYLIIDDSINSIKVNATPEDVNARVNITGNDNLKIGTNSIIITVIAQNGTTQKKYIVNVTKTTDPNNANTNLENLAIENTILTPEFNTEVLEYSTKVGSDIEKLNILAVPEIEGAIVNITGGDKLSFGNNIVTITVTAKDGVSVKIYTINVYKKTQTEEIEEENELLEQNNNIDEDNFNEELITRNLNSNTKNSNTILWIILVILIIIAISLIVYIIRKRRNKNG